MPRRTVPALSLLTVLLPVAAQAQTLSLVVPADAPVVIAPRGAPHGAHAVEPDRAPVPTQRLRRAAPRAAAAHRSEDGLTATGPALLPLLGAGVVGAVFGAGGGGGAVSTTRTR
jgi:hypothetical protein